MFSGLISFILGMATGAYVGKEKFVLYVQKLVDKVKKLFGK